MQQDREQGREQDGGDRPRSDAFPHVEPGDEDLTGVVQLLGGTYGRDGRSHPRSPNEPEVRWCLEAGVRALFEEFCAFEQGEHQAVLPANELLGAVSLRRVMVAYADLLSEHGRDPGHASRDRVLRRWGSTTAFQRDVLRYLYRPGHERARHAQRAEQLRGLYDLPFGEVARVLSSEESDVQGTDPVIQLQIALQAAFPADRRLQELVRANYEHRLEAWARIYEDVAEAFGLRVTRAGFTFRDVAAVYNTIVEGVHQRLTAHPSLGLLEDGRSLALEMTMMMTEKLDGRPWSELADLRAGRGPRG
ncbi:hypothetical protein [Nocardioides bruguierae]|uniref:Uncharacterized protein n=1 Tax=Nocardioides bruguierae TaxID=2945102 RepID=A0A9X2IDL5_9ACTN|nr:hypothetical protein [Nocardioides bruguierae]MCM0619387.1 hypothetical protein [Nocardioides bruguierae]